MIIIKKVNAKISYRVLKHWKIKGIIYVAISLLIHYFDFEHLLG